jgi:hypothetical protein
VTHRYDIPEKVMLAGNVPAMLTVSEMNQFSEYMSQTPQWKLLCAVTANVSVLSLLVSAGRFDREDELRRAIQEQQGVERLVSDITRKWYADLLAKDERPVQPIVGTDSHKYETQRK